MPTHRFPLLVAGLAPILMVACAPAEPPAGAPPTAAQCVPAGLEHFIGQKANEASGAEMLRVSGARSLRWVAPGMMVTMDFRADRLTVSYDENMSITRASCG